MRSGPFTTAVLLLGNDHLDDHHLVQRERGEQRSQTIRCDTPSAGTKRLALDHFRGHGQSMHRVALRSSAQVRQRQERALRWIEQPIPRVNLHVTPWHGQLGQYSTLSYCWGGPQQVRLVTNNLQSFQTRAKIAILYPRRFEMPFLQLNT